MGFTTNIPMRVIGAVYHGDIITRMSNYTTMGYDTMDGYKYHHPYAEEQCVFVICPTKH